MGKCVEQTAPERHRVSAPAWTPGPWVIVQDNVPWMMYVGAPRSGNPARTDSVLSEGPQQVANAHLIASAPDIAEALEELLRLIQVPHDGSDQGYLTVAMERGRAAIAKARGTA